MFNTAQEPEDNEWQISLLTFHYFYIALDPGDVG